MPPIKASMQIKTHLIEAMYQTQLHCLLPTVRSVIIQISLLPTIFKSAMLTSIINGC